jgi:hypothetical protein
MAWRGTTIARSKSQWLAPLLLRKWESPVTGTMRAPPVHQGKSKVHAREIQRRVVMPPHEGLEFAIVSC